MKTATTYLIAKKIIGLKGEDYRVKVLEDLGPCKVVVTADLRDAGTTLCLDNDRLEEIAEAEPALIHSTGLVAFA